MAIAKKEWEVMRDGLVGMSPSRQNVSLFLPNDGGLIGLTLRGKAVSAAAASAVTSTTVNTRLAIQCLSDIMTIT